MSHDANWNVAQVKAKLEGGTIRQPWCDGDHFGFLVVFPDGSTRNVEVQSDAEGNDSGWLYIGNLMPAHGKR